jgi:hypothetical protein
MRTLSIFFLLSALSACSGKSPSVEHLGLEQSSREAKVSLLWRETASGRPVALSLGNDGVSFWTSVKVSDQPQTHFKILNQAGRTQADFTVPGLGRSQIFLSQSERVIFLTRTGILRAYDLQGAVLWEKGPEENAGNRLLPYTGDLFLSIQEKGVSLWNALGEKQATFEAEAAVRRVAVLEGHPRAVLALENQRLILLDSNLKDIWGNRLRGKVLDLVIVPGDPSLVGAVWLSESSESLKYLTVFSGEGKSLASIELKGHFEQVRALSNPPVFAVYGNSPLGQALEFYEMKESEDQKFSLHTFQGLHLQNFANFTSSLATSKRGEFLLGIEDPDQAKTILLGLSQKGNLLWSVGVETEMGAYLYQIQPLQTRKHNDAFLVISTDKSRIEAHRIRF